MIHPITIGDRTGTVVYLDAQWHPTTPGQATLARVLFDDGGSAFYTITPKVDPFASILKFDKNQARDPKGSPSGGQFTSSAGRPGPIPGFNVHPPHASDVSGGVSHQTAYGSGYALEPATLPHGTGFSNPPKAIGEVVGKERFSNNPHMVEAKPVPEGVDPAVTPLLTDATPSGDDIEGGVNASMVVEMKDGTKALYKPESGECWTGSFANRDISRFITNRDLSLGEREAMAYEVGHALFKDDNPVPPTVLRESLDVDVPERGYDDDDGGGGYDDDELQRMYQSYQEKALDDANVGTAMGELREADRKEHAEDVGHRAEEIAEIWNELVEDEPADHEGYGAGSALRAHPALPMGSQPGFGRQEDLGALDILEVIDEAKVQVNGNLTPDEKIRVRDVLKQKLKDGYSELGDVDESAALSHWNSENFYDNHQDTENRLRDEQIDTFDAWKQNHGYQSNNNNNNNNNNNSGGGGGGAHNDQAPHPNGGSLQQMNTNASNYGDASEEDGVRMAVLDYVIGTMDRHGGNIMYEDDKPVAIDNGYSVPGSGSASPDGFRFRSKPVQEWLNGSDTDVTDEMAENLSKAMADTDWNAFCDRHPAMSTEERGGLLGRVVKMRKALEVPDGLYQLWKKQRIMS